MPEDFFAPVRDLGEGDALEDWRWLVGKNCHALLLTAMGDLFIRRPPRLLRREAIFFLDTMSGRIERVAASYALSSLRRTPSAGCFLKSSWHFAIEVFCSLLASATHQSIHLF